MGKPTYGRNAGLTGLVDSASANAKLVVNVKEEGDVTFKKELKLRPYMHKANTHEKFRIIGIQSSINGNGMIRTGEIGLNNVGDTTNGTGTITLLFGNGRKVTVRGTFAMVVISQKGTERARVGFVIVGDVTEASDVESGAPTEASV